MRSLALWTICLVLAAGEAAALPATTQKLVDDSVAVATKARQAYDQAVAKEQAKLAAALAKEQERETKKGNLDGALAIKALIDEVEKGLLATKADESSGLLGDESKPAAPGTTPANLLTDCPFASVAALRTESPPKSIEAMMGKASMLAIPKGDKTHYNFSAASSGTIAIVTGTNERIHAEFWQELTKAGFKQASDGGGGAWFILEAKPGSRFIVYDPPQAAAQVRLFAGRIKPAH